VNLSIFSEQQNLKVLFAVLVFKPPAQDTFGVGWSIIASDYSRIRAIERRALWTACASPEFKVQKFNVQGSKPVER
jgi:hypothetical protein